MAVDVNWIFSNMEPCHKNIWLFLDTCKYFGTSSTFQWKHGMHITSNIIGESLYLHLLLKGFPLEMHHLLITNEIFLELEHCNNAKKLELN